MALALLRGRGWPFCSTPMDYDNRGRGRRVLVIDDDEQVLGRVATFLGAKGFAVETTSNVFGVAGMVRAHPPDVVVVDINMPALKGDEVARTLVRRYDLQVVFYSSVDDDIGRALAAPYENASFVSKGDGIRCLFEHIATRVARSRSAAT